jgi:hypothetical protein
MDVAMIFQTTTGSRSRRHGVLPNDPKSIHCVAAGTETGFQVQLSNLRPTAFILRALFTNDYVELKTIKPSPHQSYFNSVRPGLN